MWPQVAQRHPEPAVSSSIDIINWLQSTFGENSRFLFEFFSVAGGPYGWLVVTPLVFWLAGSKVGLRVAFTVVIAMIINTLLKWAIAEPRPYYVSNQVRAMLITDGFGMPSGHAQGVAAHWCALAVSIRQSWCTYLAVLFILLTGAARVYFGVHSHQQVAVGWAVGLIAVVIATRIEVPLTTWVRSKSIVIQIGSVLGVATLIVTIGWGIAFGLRDGVAAPADWQARWQSTVDRLVDQRNEKAVETELILVRPARIIAMTGLLVGCSICGLRILHTGEINPTSNVHRVTNLVVGIPVMVMIALFLRPHLNVLIGETAALFAIATVLPSLVGIVIPEFTLRQLAARR